MYTFIRIPKSGSTSIMASVLRLYPNFDNSHRTIDEIGRDHRFFTMIRDPLQQYCSAYYFAKDLDQNMYDPTKFVINTFRDHIDVINQTNTLEEYLLNSPENAFLGKYLCGVPPTDLECVGHIDYMDDTRKLFNVMLGLPIIPAWHRKNPNRQEIYTVSSDILEKFAKRNAIEYDLYAQGSEYFFRLMNRL